MICEYSVRCRDRIWLSRTRHIIINKIKWCEKKHKIYIITFARRQEKICIVEGKRRGSRLNAPA